MNDYNITNVWSISSDLFYWLKKNSNEDTVILEFGSGLATEYILKICKTLYSIEESQEWLNRYHNNYIFAPIKEKWYDLDILKKNLPNKCDIIIVDGPSQGERIGFFNNINLFDFKENGCEFLIFDDVHRNDDYICYIKVLDYLKNLFGEQKIETEVINGNEKNFSYIKIKR